MQCILAKLEPDVRNNYSTRINTWSIPLKLLCCSLLKNICRLQAEIIENFHVSPWGFGHSQHCSALTQKVSMPLLGGASGKCLWEAFITKCSMWTGMVLNSLHLQTLIVSMRSSSPKPPKERTHISEIRLWSKWPL